MIRNEARCAFYKYSFISVLTLNYYCVGCDLRERLAITKSQFYLLSQPFIPYHLAGSGLVNPKAICRR
jgi:hypothetical protein